MKNLHNTGNIKEKEQALSLFRIPLNFFEDSKKSDATKNIQDNSNPDKIQVDSSADKKISDENHIHVDIAPSSGKITISKEFDIPQRQTTSASSSKSKPANESESESDETSDSTEATTEEDTSTSSSEANAETQVPSSEKTSHKPQQVSPMQPAAQQSASTTASDTSEAKNSKPKTADKEEETEQESKSTASEKDTENASRETESPNTPPQQTSNQQPSAPSSTPAQQPADKPHLPKDDPNKKKKADEFKDRFSKTPAGQKINNVKNNAKNKVADKIASNPAASKTLNTLKNAKDTVDTAKEAINNLDAEKMKEAVGETAVQVASKAGDAVIPGLGKAVTAVDKVVGQTEIGKKAKKALGGCCCAVGCIVPIISVLVIVAVMVQGFSWITDLFSRDDSIYGELSESDYQRIAEASTLYSMQEYTDLTLKLNDPTFLQQLLGTAAEFPIQEALEEYMENHYRYTEDDVREYERKYGDLVEKGYLMPIKADDLTSFGTAFEMLKKNYSVFNLKAPTSAPEREKTLTNGEVVKYPTYDPEGIHQALFEDVLNDIDLLKTRFDGQVDPAWFDELNALLDTPISVYLEGYDGPPISDDPELAGTFPKRTLRELFIETSQQIDDTEFDAYLINKAFSKYNSINKEIIEQYNELVEDLSMLELMTYMLSYQKYYSQIEAFNKSIQNSLYENKYMFDDEFWGQFLTFSNVEYYLALSNLSDHSLTYEIAVASLEGSLNNLEMDTYTTSDGKKYLMITKFDNWFATYYLNPEIIANESGLSYTMTPTMEKTQIQQFLFDKYNVEADIFENEHRTDAQNQNSFFGAFELATGLQIAIQDDEGNEQRPVYYMNSEGMISSTQTYLSGASNIPDTLGTNKAFPIDPNTDTNVTIGFSETYSAATTSALGMAPNTVHSGIDYKVPIGTDILAAAPGVVHIFTGNSGYGNYIRIDHPDGYSSYYAHGNGNFFVSEGQTVVTGQKIMESGNSGNSTGPHLHFEIRDPSGTPINPNSYITT